MTVNSPATGAAVCLARRAAAFSSSFSPSTVSKLSSSASLVLSLVLAFSTSYSTVTAMEVLRSLSMAAVNLALYSSKTACSTSPSSFNAAMNSPLDLDILPWSVFRWATWHQWGHQG